jgi:spore germination cell wall hydrolase CwlJ-like protein
MKWLLAILCAVSFSAYGKSEVKCLAETVYHESRGESFYGRLAVAQVVVNRVRQDPWPNSICRVVFQKNQFSWTRGWKTWKHDRSSMAIARLVWLQPEHPLMYFKATHFHSGKYPRSWPALTHVKTIGKHHFYK